MLTHTDVHLLVGLLSLITNPDGVEVELGSKVLDEASGTERDVDITITTRNGDGSLAAYAGIEVKDEAAPLGTPTVEQLIGKLRDMPSITRRSIVSSSGYTSPAKAKAKFHGVELLTLKSWRKGKRVFPFLNPKLDASIRTVLFQWAGRPNVECVVDGPGDVEAPWSAIVRTQDGNIMTLRQAADRVIDYVLTTLTNAGAFSDLPPGVRRQVRRRVSLEQTLHCAVGRRGFRIIGFDIDGTVRGVMTSEAPEMKLLINDATGDPHAACLVGLLPTNALCGAVFTKADPNPHMVMIPVSDRNLRCITRLKLRRDTSP